jgi:predicted CXXCH cytochrome family protein
VSHAWVDQLDDRTAALRPGALDAPALGAERGRIYVVRFQLVNSGEIPLQLRPILVTGAGPAPATWSPVSAADPVRGIPFYTSADGPRGEEPGTTVIPADRLRLSTSSDPAGSPTPGIAHVGINPGPELELPPHTFTELSFTIRATADAEWLGTYAIRLGDAAEDTDSGTSATIVMRARPPLVLSPGQRSGIEVGPPLPRYPLDPRGGATGSRMASTGIAAGAGFASPHLIDGLASDACAACHSAHRGKSAMLLVRPAPQSALCFTCHNGTGASVNVAAQYSDPGVPANDPATDAWYSHPATALSNHTSDRDPAEFAGVLNRHSACADCHQPHLADDVLAVETVAGWTTSGALKGASGVGVSYALDGTPTYTWKPAAAYEYELCFKCHSGFTQLKPQAGGASRWALDKAVELNPDNPSFHPVLAAGTNDTNQMTLSLKGTSPYKLWTFTTASTVRCVNCHGDPRLANPDAPPAAGQRLAPHAVENRGMLIANLRDRQLKLPSDPYDDTDFALCYVCHAEAPFVEPFGDGTPETNFSFHGLHIVSTATFTGSSGGTVDDPGAGRGNAICAECHFRTHGTSYRVDGQDPGPRLVNFAPNVQPYQGSGQYAGQLQWDATNRSCTLTCHGQNHGARTY